MVLEGLLYARHRARRWRCSPDTHTPDFCLHRTYSLKRESEKTNRSQPENLGEKKENIFSSTLESAIFQGDIKLRDIIFGVTIVCMGLKAVRMRSPKKTQKVSNLQLRRGPLPESKSASPLISYFQPPEV
ncbi:uncharacterized protein LOC119867182 isoform X10 [Canis lupus familiaris]|uniref:uncharacterized protein LOC119867182 isoform X10 n=1 Tax=Canis lupus familiaris TaxID=9615 RepID=UPI0018F4EF1D|nr:uncharacterized protein LOC119867182 isoform X10 [Canis lupus familiaris]